MLATPGGEPAQSAERRDVILGHAIPSSVIATRPDGAEGTQWCDGGARSLAHNQWRLLQRDAEMKLTNGLVTIDFDVIVDRGGVSLLDRPDDELTRRLLCIDNLLGGFSHKPRTALETAMFANTFDWIVRFRNDIGIARMSDFETRHFDEFKERIRSDEILGLVSTHDRLTHIIAEAESGRYRLRSHTPNYCRERIDWEGLAADLGVTSYALTRCRWIRAKLLEALPALAPGYSAALAASLSDRSCSAATPNTISARKVETYLTVFRHIHLQSARGLQRHDPLTFDPLGGRRPRVLAIEIGVPPTRTQSLSPEAYFKVVSKAAKWVLEFSDHITAALKQLYVRMSERKTWCSDFSARDSLAAELEAAAPSGLPALILYWTTQSAAPAGSMTVGQAVKHLLTACFILVASFGARRVEEALSIQAGCIKETKPGMQVLSILIERASRQREDIPAVPLVAFAVKALEGLTEPTRDLSGEDWLFEVARSLDCAYKRHVSFRPEDGLTAFAALCGLNFDVAPHMLRRGAAIAFYHGCRFATVDAASYWLRHLDPAVTRIYFNEILPGLRGRLREDIDARSRVATEQATLEDREWLRTQNRRLQTIEESATVWDEVRCEAIVHRLLQTYFGEEKPIGRGAASLRADVREMAEQALAHVRIGPRLNQLPKGDPKFLELLQRYARSHSLDPIPGGIAHCTVKPGNQADLAEAECLKAKAFMATPWSGGDASGGGSDIRQDYAFTADYVCLRCRHCCSFSEGQAIIGAELARLHVSVEVAATENSRLDARERYLRLKEAAAGAATAMAGTP